MAEMVASALAQEGVSRASSYVSTKLEDKASRAHNMARVEMALSRLEFVLERTGTLPISHVSLLRRRKMLKNAYIEGTGLINKHKLGILVTGSSYLQWIASAANLSISSLVGFNKEHCLNSSVAQTFEWYADCADKFVTDVESGCPLRLDTFRYPFVRQLFEGKYLSYRRVKGSQEVSFRIWPAILEGHGVEAELRYHYFDSERLDRSFSVASMLRLSESTDIVGVAINCLQSSALLLNVVPQDAVGELALLHNLQDISYSYAPPWVQEWHIVWTRYFRSDPLCCQANGHGPCVKNIVSSEFPHMFPEQTIVFLFKCYIPAVEPSLSIASDEAGRNVMTDWPCLELMIGGAPHHSLCGDMESICIFKEMGSKEEEKQPYGKSKEEKRPYGKIQQTIGTMRSKAMDYLICEPQVTRCSATWFSKHGSAYFEVKKPSTGRATLPKTRGRYKYNTRGAAKRKR